jgi:hypothetical protein
MLRNIVSVVAGIIASAVLIAIVEVISHKIYPPPTGIDFNNKEVLKELMNTMPKGALLMVILAHAIGTFGGGVVTALIATEKRIMFSAITGGVVLIMGIVNLIMLPHPVWFAIADILVYIPFAYFGALLALKVKP